MLVALVPLGLVSLAHVRQSQQNADDTLLAASVGWTLQQGLYDLRMMRAAQNTGELLATSLGNDPDNCAALVGNWVRTDVRIDHAGMVNAEGRMLCSSDGRLRDFSNDPRLAGLLEARRRVLFRDTSWAPGGRNGISLAAPVIGQDGKYLGFSLVFLPDRLLRGTAGRHPGQTSPEQPPQTPLALAAVANDSEMLYVVPDSHETRRLLSRAMLGTMEPGLREAHSFIARDADGIERIFAVVPSAEDLSLIGVWPLPRGNSTFQRYILPYLSPALMWLTGLAVTLIGTERLVTRHISRLSNGMRNFALGDRKHPEILLDNPSYELADLADSYAMLTNTIMRDEAELENLLHKNSELLREVHHRTGNSLQLIASILRMHRREAEDSGIRVVLDDLHNRVMSLSSVHLGLYRMAGGQAIAMDQLMADVIARVDLLQGRSGRRGGIMTDLEPLHLTSRQAVPLALLLAEILSCFPPAESNGQPVRIRLHSGMAHDSANTAPGRTAWLEVSGSVTAIGRLTGDHSGAPAVIGARLIRGFVTQLPGEMAISEEGERVRAVIRFDVQEEPTRTEPAEEPALTG
ncbi:sensor histidine kinase [Pseudogemmobacter faecipullorum]|uniref:histidine kinase n=1 Tax=Pseudogemmobacter faecipullorum TaxID=2755041 RepID=A0ABS8CKL0_9RHOB|nr:histidine kinase dimerization/phosphoacceptor domain -containing protein [Pseudogemmobacter faecipullorum]MCB5409926.1 hypothetical protein [Pseudogemmobacter faecipullorum]